MKGRVHSIETMGMLDGPGIRYIAFLQGCVLRCQFCHNPDTWNIQGGELTDSETLLEEIKSYLPYYQASGGGVTVSGGEPLVQASFVLDLFKKCKEAGIHTTLDTTGIIWSPDVEQLLDYTDLVLLDLKEMDPDKHSMLTGCSNTNVLRFARELEKRQVKVWIRHVIVPGLTDELAGLEQIGQFIQGMANVEKVELLPFHKMGEYKWERLGHSYKLSHVSPPTEEEMRAAYACIEPYLLQ